MATTIVYRPARASDADGLDVLVREAGFHHHALAPHIFVKPVPGSRSLAPELPRPGDEAWLCVAEADARIVGFVSAEVVHEDRDLFRPVRFVRIERVAVLGQYRGQGIGRHLVGMAEAWARQMNCAEARLNVLSAYARALELYEKLGYTVASVSMGKPLRIETGPA